MSWVWLWRPLQGFKKPGERFQCVAEAENSYGPHWSSHLGVHHTRLEGLLGANCNPQPQCLIQGIGGGSPEYASLRSFQVMLLLLV